MVTKVQWKLSGLAQTRRDFFLAALQELSKYGMLKNQKVCFHLL